MKMKRMVAFLVCMFLLICTIPAITISATGTDTFDSIEEIMGVEKVFCAGYQHLFDENYAHVDAGHLEADGYPGRVTYTADGMSFPAGETTLWKLTPQLNPFADKNATLITAKFGSLDEKMEVQFQDPSNVGRVYISITPSIVGAYGTGNVRVEETFDFGTDWFDLLTVSDETGHDIYVRNDETDQKWKFLLSVEGFRSSSVASGKFCIAGTVKTGFLVKEVAVYKEYIEEQSVAEVMGVEEASCQAYQHLFDENYAHSDAGHLEADGYPGRVTYTAEGMSFPIGETTIWRLTPKLNPFAEKNATLVSAKFGSLDEKMELQFQNPSNVGRVYISLTPSKITAHGAFSSSASYNFGTDWFDLLTISDETGHDIYVKNSATKGKWNLLLTVEGFRSGSVAAGKLCIAGTVNTGFLIKEVSVYKEVKKYQSIEEIVGGPVASAYAFEFDKTFDTTVANSSRAGIRYPKGVSFTEEGMTLSRVTDSASTNNYGVWNFTAYDKWSPLNERGTWETENYTPQVFYTKVKGRVNFQLRAPSAEGGRVYINSYPGQNIGYWANGGEAVYQYVQPDDNWMEYLVVPKATAAEGYVLYAKSDTVTNGVWVRVLETAGYQGTGQNTIGIQFADTGYVKEARALSCATVSDKESKSLKDSALLFEEDFFSKPSGENITTKNLSVSNGVATFRANFLTGVGKYALNNVEIPVNGYAEFRTRTDGTHSYSFDDGEKKLSIYLPKDYGIITDGNGMICDGSNTWRTFRVVRSSEGYSVYSKTDADKYWMVNAINVSEAGSGTPAITMTFESHYSGSGIGNSQLDYLRIYAPVPDKLSLTDGDTNVEVEEDQELLYPETVYARVQPDPDNARKLIYAEYGQDDVLKKVETTDIPAGTETFTKVFDLSDKEGKVRRYQFMLWDGLSDIVPGANSKTVRGNLWTWTDNWSLSGGATRTESELLLKSEYGKEAMVEYPNAVGDSYDITWKMKAGDFSGSKTVRIYTGSHFAEFDVKQDGVTYQTNSGEMTIPWSLDTKEHLYRLIGKDGTASLYIDGYHVTKTGDLISSTEVPKIQISNAGVKNKVSNLSISRFESRAYSSANIPAEGYFDNFDAANGWNMPNSDGFSWYLKDGYLQVQDLLIESSQPYTQKSIPIADDYIINTRMKIESFGYTANLNLYMQNYCINLNFRQMFLAMNTAAGQVVYSDEMKIDTTKWYDFRLETYNNCKNVRVYLDGVKVAESETVKVDQAHMVAQFQANGGYQEYFDIKLDWFHCAPKQYGISVSSPADGAVFREGDTILLDAVAPTGTEMVQYLVNNKVVASGTEGSNTATLSELPAGTYEVKAVSGTAVSNPILFKVQKEKEAGSLPEIRPGEGYANEISYTASGDGAVRVGNGNHLLQLTHNGGALRYLTDTGEESYAFGTGDFYAITDGPVADVYRNGQFAFSYFMPMTDEVIADFSGGVTSGTVVTSAERKTYFAARNVTDQKKVYRLSNLPSSHVLDFVADSSDEVHLSLNDGYYRNDISIENGEIYLWNGQRNNSNVKRTKVATVEPGKEVYYRAETAQGISRLYANGRFVALFRGGITVGGNTLSVDVKSGSLKYLAVCDNVDLYLYQDDFSGNGEFESVDYWMPTNATVRANSAQQNFVIETTGDGFAELSPFCGNVDISANVMVDFADSFWIVNNHVVTESYNRAGYNFNTGQYEIADVVKSEVKDIVTKAGSFPMGDKVHMEVKVREHADGETVTLYVNGEEVLSKVTEFDSRGRVGFLLSMGSATIDDVNFRGDAKLIVGQTDHIDTSGMTLDLIENRKTGQVYMGNSGSYNVTKDGGKTWESVGLSPNNGLSADGYGGMSTHMLQLKDGTVLSACLYHYSNDEYGQRKQVYRVYKSTDYGMTWEQFTSNAETFPGVEEAAVGESATVNALKQGYSGRIYFVKQKDANEDYGGLEVWYSSNGKNWFKSETEIRAKKLGFVIAEGVVIETRKSTRLYFRTDMGALGYFTSYDLGETWDLTPHMTPLISPASCFNIDVDPEEPDTLYAGWIYDNVNLYARHQFPRTRWSVAKSTDAGETWEMIGTVHENNSYYINNMNLNIAVSSGHVFLAGYSSDHYKAVTPYTSRILSFPKDVQRTSKRLETLHMQYPTQVENTKVMDERLTERTMAVHPESGAVWLRGERIEGAASGEYVDVYQAAALVGAKVETGTDGTVGLSIGEEQVSLKAEDCKIVDGKTFVKLSSFATEFGLSIVEEDGVKIVSENDDWSVRQKNAFRYAVDLFSNQP